MAVIGGLYVNHYGPVADCVVTVVGEGNSDQYTLSASYKEPGLNFPREIGRIDGTVNIGQTKFHAFPVELPPVSDVATHTFTAGLGGDTGAVLTPDMPPTTADPGQVGFPDNTNPLPDLVTPMNPGADIQTDVILSRSTGRETASNGLYYVPHLLSGDLVWYEKSRGSVGDKTEIGGGSFKFGIDWSVNDQFQSDPEVPITTTTGTQLTTPDTIGDYEFCIETENISYYVPSDSEWHASIDRL